MNLLSKYRAGFIALCFGVASLAPIAQAQNGNLIAQVNVPFAFECGSQQYPAGVYSIRNWGPDLLLFSGSSRSGFAMTKTQMNVRKTERGNVVFHVVGHQHFLHLLRTAGDTAVFYPSKAEQDVERASNSVRQPDVQLALLDAPR